MANESLIVRRKRVFAAGGHHGGQWKVAYADFVTAMMAFFMLMWILNATTEDQRRGLADFFNPSVPLASTSGGGSDVLWGDRPTTSDMLASTNHGGTTPSMMDGRTLIEELSQKLAEELEQGQAKLTMTPQGVVVDLMDTADQPVFPLGKSSRTERLVSILERIAPALIESARPIKISGHTDDRTFMRPDYSNWELSADRANAARRVAIAQGLPAERIVEVSGHADRLPVADDPSAPQNRRISILVYHQAAQPLGGR